LAIAILFDVIAGPDRVRQCAPPERIVLVLDEVDGLIISSDSSPARDQRLTAKRGEAAAQDTCDRRFVINDQNSP
jgi:hypothetical protein